MADFNSNFNDIQKQIAVADLTDEQIQELVTALQTKRNARPELTKEDRDISAKTVGRLSEIPMVQLHFAPSCLLVSGLSLSS